MSVFWILFFHSRTGWPCLQMLQVEETIKMERDPSPFDHPLRCFIYLFPSRQTWFLLTVLVILNFTNWFLFLVLNVGIFVFDAVPVGRRFLLGLVQAVSVRFAGF
ncbi:hypothetical protein EDB86DRAFT_2972198 [Lactarius hatsudake]|nr:hypothetical protein EDB86DRAFT_2972198 [Lactarius hatsudake]